MMKLMPKQLCRRCKNNEISNEEFVFVELLKACAKKKDVIEGARLHNDILERGFLDRNPFIASTLINMYAKCGVLIKAHEVLDQLAFRDVVCWSALISGYSRHGKGNEALKCFTRMHNEGISSDTFTFVSALNACGSIRAIGKGIQIHEETLTRGLLHENVVLGNALLDMYLKCGTISSAKQVFSELPAKNVVTWNTLIAGYARHGQGNEAFDCFEEMKQKGFSPDYVSFICILKACGHVGSIHNGIQIHDEIVARGFLGRNILLDSSLVDMYVKCFALTKAAEVLDELPVRNTSCWNALISGYTQRGLYIEALNCFERMEKEGLSPDVTTFISILKACSGLQAVDIGEKIQEQIVGMGLWKKNVALDSALVDMYAKCGIVSKAQKIFDELPTRDLVSWCALITGYIRQGQALKALNCFEQMQSEGLCPDSIIFISVLKACGSVGAIDKGKEIHDEVVNQGLLQNDNILGTALVDMYVKCGSLTKAQEVHDELTVRSIASYNALIAGYAEHGPSHLALNCYDKMQTEDLVPDAVTFVSVLKVCSSIGELKMGKQLHDEIVARGLMCENIVLGTALVNMYAKCGLLEKAHEVLDQLPVRDAVCWNPLVAGYAEYGLDDEALNSFGKMQKEGLCPDVVTFIGILKACGNKRAIQRGMQIHEEIVHRDLLGESSVLGNALVEFYVKCGMLSKAEQVFDKLPVRDSVSLNLLIGAYIQQGQSCKALDYYERMRNANISPDAVTFTYVLRACASVGAIQGGKQIHDDIASRQLLENDVVLGTALVDMYAKCGMLDKARELLCEHVFQDLASWNAVLAGYAKQGKGHEALACFDQMQREGVIPNGITMLCVLSACSHSGLVEEVQTHYENMTKKYGITPKLEHHTCIIDVFGSAGYFDKAMSVINTMPSSCYAPVWLTLLNACKKWGNVELGRFAFDQVIQIDNNAIYYTLMANIYAAVGMQEEADKIEALRIKKKKKNNSLKKRYIDITHFHLTFKNRMEKLLAY